MWLDVEHLYGFYETPLGHLTQNALRRPLEALWHDTRGQTLVAFGYGMPFLEGYLEKSDRVLFLMPAPCGVCPWPVEGKNLTCLCPVDVIPLPDCSVHKLLFIHCLEFAPDARILLREAWRVLVPGGELMIVVPNRRGLWARAPTTPFGDGKPYSGRQLYALAEGACFSPFKPTYHLFHPPIRPFLPMSAQEALEDFGQKWLKKIGGLALLRAEKKVIANVKERTPSLGQRIFMPDSLLPQKRALGRNALKGKTSGKADQSSTSGENSKTPGSKV